MSEWHHAREGRRQGPWTLAELQQGIRDGRVAPDDLVWRRGMSDWQPVREVAELREPVAAQESATGRHGLPENPYSTPQSLAAAPKGPRAPFDLGVVLRQGWEAFARSFLFGLFCLMVLIGASVLATIADLLLEQQWFGFAVGLFVTTHVQAGAMLGAIRAVRGQEPGIGTVFEPFRTSYLRLLAFGLVYNVLVLGALAVLGVLLVGGFSSEALHPAVVISGALLGLVLMVWVSIRLYFTSAFIVDRRIGPVDAALASWRATSGRALPLFALALLGMVILCLGALMLFVGIIPAAWLAISLAGAAYVNLGGPPPATHSEGSPP